MGLFDLFRPKWKHSNLYVRFHAVKELTDPLILAKIVKKDLEYSVRKQAVENPNFTDQAVLAEIAINDEVCGVQCSAVEKITDQTLLIKIAKTAKISKDGNFARKEAVKKITDQSVLFDIAKNNDDDATRGEAVENPNFTDQDLLADFARNDENERVRSYAVEKLNDKEIIFNIILKDNSERVYKTIIESLSEQSKLKSIAKNHMSEYARRLAIQNPNLTDQGFITDIAKNDTEKEYSVRFAALEKITNQEVVTEICKEIITNEKNWEVRYRAVGKIFDQSILSDIAQNDEDKYVRYAAINKISDQSILIDIAKNNDDESVRSGAIERISDPEIRINIAKMDKSENVRRWVAADEKKKNTYPDFCSICGKNCTGLPIMKHRLTGLNCCEDCGRIIGGVSNFIILATKASQCSICGFLYISSFSKFNTCPRCGKPVK